MRRYIHTIVVAVTLVALPALALAQVSLGAPFTIRVGHSVQIGDLEVGFDAVPDDGRCAIGLLCFWEGNAVCDMWADTPKADRAEFKLNTSGMFPREAVYEGYRISLWRLDPYPVYQFPPDPNSYIATIIVTADPTTTPIEQTTWGRIKALYVD